MAGKEPRTVTGQLPAVLGGGTIVLRELSASMEIDASREMDAKGGTKMALMHALGKRALVEYQGEKVSWEDGKIDELWDRIGSKGRRFVLYVFNREFWSDEDQEILDFLATFKT